jgi:hypothetical protein
MYSARFGSSTATVSPCLQALRIGPRREAVGERVELAIGVAFAFEQHRCVVGEFIDGVFEIVADEHVRESGSILRTRPKRAREAVQKSELRARSA